MSTGRNRATPGAPGGHGSVVRIFLAVTASLSLIAAASTAFAFVSYKAAEDAGTKEGFQRRGAGPEENVATGPCVDDVCNYLILGSDSRTGLTEQELDDFGTDAEIGGESRSDTIMLVHSDPRREKAVILSFPRDLWVNIPGVGHDKINAAFQGGIDGGGPNLVAETVHRLTGLRINHFVYVDLAGFQGIVETLDGVEMCIPAENVNTPATIEGPSGDVYYDEPGYIADPFTGLLVRPGCQVLDADQALAYVRTRHLPCDEIPDFARINRQQEFLSAVINRLLEPSQIVQAPSLVRPVLASLKRDRELTPADLVFLVGQMQGVSTGAAEFRSVPGTVGEVQPSWSDIPLSVVNLDPAAEDLFAALREGTPLPKAAVLEDTEPSAATITVPVVDHASAGRAAEVNQILADAGFIASGVVAFDPGSGVKGSVIAYEPGHEVEAQVVAKYFPGLKLVESEAGALPGADVAVFVTASYEPQEPGSGPETPCIKAP